jgi:anthranilate phosphoribosyltransferase
VQADPEPQRNRFVRSDQYSFIKAGIPALAMKVGYEENTPQAEIARQWTAERYHAPSDDLKQPIDLGAAFRPETQQHQAQQRRAQRDDRIIARQRNAQESPCRDVVLLNAAATLVAAGRAKHLSDAIPIAVTSIDSGAAAAKLKALLEFTQQRASRSS